MRSQSQPQVRATEIADCAHKWGGVRQFSCTAEFVAVERRLSRSEVTVNNVTALTDALADGRISKILLEQGTYKLDSQLTLNRNLTMVATVAGTVALDGQTLTRVMHIAAGVVELINQTIRGGRRDVRLSQTTHYPLTQLQQ